MGNCAEKQEFPKQKDIAWGLPETILCVLINTR